MERRRVRGKVITGHPGSGERALEKRVTELPTQECWTTSQVGNALPPGHPGGNGFFASLRMTWEMYRYRAAQGKNEY